MAKVNEFQPFKLDRLNQQNQSILLFSKLLLICKNYFFIFLEEFYFYFIIKAKNQLIILSYKISKQSMTNRLVVNSFFCSMPQNGALKYRKSFHHFPVHISRSQHQFQLRSDSIQSIHKSRKKFKKISELQANPMKKKDVFAFDKSIKNFQQELAKKMALQMFQKYQKQQLQIKKEQKYLLPKLKNTKNESLLRKVEQQNQQNKQNIDKERAKGSNFTKYLTELTTANNQVNQQPSVRTKQSQLKTKKCQLKNKQSQMKTKQGQINKKQSQMNKKQSKENKKSIQMGKRQSQLKTQMSQQKNDMSQLKTISQIETKLKKLKLNNNKISLLPRIFKNNKYIRHNSMFVNKNQDLIKQENLMQNQKLISLHLNNLRQQILHQMNKIDFNLSIDPWKSEQTYFTQAQTQSKYEQFNPKFRNSQFCQQNVKIQNFEYLTQKDGDNQSVPIFLDRLIMKNKPNKSKLKNISLHIQIPNEVFHETPINILVNKKRKKINNKLIQTVQ